jgi:Acyl carrier protein phosphodiesterase
MNILHIDASPRIESYSRALSAGIVDRLLDANPWGRVVRRDLGWEPIPHASEEYARALATPAALALAQDGDELGLSETLIREVEAADVVVIGTPMNNFTLPSVLKAWVDQVLRKGRTFTSAGAGKKVGLLEDRPVYVAIASGSVFAGEGANQPDFLRPYLSAAFGCIGIHNVHYLPLQATSYLEPAALDAAFDALLESFHEVCAAA